MKKFFKYYVFLTIAICGCKNNIDSKGDEKNRNIKAALETNTGQNALKDGFTSDTILNKSDSTLDKLQGIWSGEKDLNQSMPYRIQINKKVLDIVCVEGICNNTIDNAVLELSQIGFSNLEYDNSTAKGSFHQNILESSGKIMVKIGGETKIDENYQINEVSYSTKLTSNYMYDEELYNLSSFVKINSLPLVIYQKLKALSVIDNKDYLKEYRVYTISKKIKVNSPKTFFHTEMTGSSKRKAFLLKNDIAYLEEEYDDWVKVYFDGESISSGFLKKDDVEVLNSN